MHSSLSWPSRLRPPLHGAAQQPAKPAPKASTEDSRLRAIYNAEDVWRKSQRGAQDEDHPHRIPAQLPFRQRRPSRRSTSTTGSLSFTRLTRFTPRFSRPTSASTTRSSAPRSSRSSTSKPSANTNAPSTPTPPSVRRRRHRPRDSANSAGLRELHRAAPRHPALLPRKHREHARRPRPQLHPAQGHSHGRDQSLVPIAEANRRSPPSTIVLREDALDHLCGRSNQAPFRCRHRHPGQHHPRLS